MILEKEQTVTCGGGAAIKNSSQDDMRAKRVEGFAANIEALVFERGGYMLASDKRIRILRNIPEYSELEAFPQLFTGLRRLVDHRIAEAINTGNSTDILSIKCFLDSVTKNDKKDRSLSDEEKTASEIRCSELKEELVFLTNIEDNMTQISFLAQASMDELREMTFEQFSVLREKYKVMTADEYFTIKYGEFYSERKTAHNVFFISGSDLLRPNPSMIGQLRYDSYCTEVEEKLGKLEPMVVVGEVDGREVMVPLPFYRDKEPRINGITGRLMEYLADDSVEHYIKNVAHNYNGKVSRIAKNYFSVLGTAISDENIFLQKEIDHGRDARFSLPSQKLDEICALQAGGNVIINNDYMEGIKIFLTKETDFEYGVGGARTDDPNNKVVANFFYRGRRVGTTYPIQVNELEDVLNMIRRGDNELFNDDSRSLHERIDDIVNPQKESASPSKASSNNRHKKNTTYDI